MIMIVLSLLGCKTTKYKPKKYNTTKCVGYYNGY